MHDVLLVSDQDGTTHWGSDTVSCQRMGDDHGFNFFTNLYGSTPENGLWVLPGSHRSVLPCR